MTAQSGPITRPCVCDPEKGTTCAHHGMHPVTDDVATIETQLAEAQARYEQSLREIDKAQDELRLWSRARNRAEDRIGTLRSDLRIARQRG